MGWRRSERFDRILRRKGAALSGSETGMSTSWIEWQLVATESRWGRDEIEPQALYAE